MVVESQTIRKLVKHLEHNLDEIEKLQFSRTQLVEDEDIQIRLDRRLHMATEDAIDLASHIAAGLGLPNIDTYADVFLALGKHGVIQKVLGKRFTKLTGFRNILVHGYRDIEYPLVFKNYKGYIKSLRDFTKATVTFLEKNPHLVE